MPTTKLTNILYYPLKTEWEMPIFIILFVFTYLCNFFYKIKPFVWIFRKFPCVERKGFRYATFTMVIKFLNDLFTRWIKKPLSTQCICSITIMCPHWYHRRWTTQQNPSQILPLLTRQMGKIGPHFSLIPSLVQTENWYLWKR